MRWCCTADLLLLTIIHCVQLVACSNCASGSALLLSLISLSLSLSSQLTVSSELRAQLSTQHSAHSALSQQRCRRPVKMGYGIGESRKRRTPPALVHRRRAMGGDKIACNNNQSGVFLRIARLVIPAAGRRSAVAVHGRADAASRAPVPREASERPCALAACCHCFSRRGGASGCWAWAR